MHHPDIEVFNFISVFAMVQFFLPVENIFNIDADKINKLSSNRFIIRFHYNQVRGHGTKIDRFAYALINLLQYIYRYFYQSFGR